MVVQGFQHTTLQKDPSPYKSLEQSVRPLQSRAGTVAPTQQEAVSEDEIFSPFSTGIRRFTTQSKE